MLSSSTMIHGGWSFTKNSTLKKNKNKQVILCCLQNTTEANFPIITMFSLWAAYYYGLLIIDWHHWWQKLHLFDAPLSRRCRGHAEEVLIYCFLFGVFDCCSVIYSDKPFLRSLSSKWSMMSECAWENEPTITICSSAADSEMNDIALLAPLPFLT